MSKWSVIYGQQLQCLILLEQSHDSKPTHSSLAEDAKSFPHWCCMHHLFALTLSLYHVSLHEHWVISFGLYSWEWQLQAASCLKSTSCWCLRQCEVIRIVSVNFTQNISSSFVHVKVVAGHPLAGHGRGMHVLNALQSLGPIVHPSLPDMWDGVVPKLCQHLEGLLLLCSSYSRGTYTGYWWQRASVKKQRAVLSSSVVNENKDEASRSYSLFCGSVLAEFPSEFWHFVVWKASSPQKAYVTCPWNRKTRGTTRPGFPVK